MSIDVSQVIPGDNHRVTMVAGDPATHQGVHEDWYLISSQFAGTGERQTGILAQNDPHSCPDGHPSPSGSPGPPISHGLEAWYTFNERSAVDSSGHNFHGRWEGQENYAEGKPGKMTAASFDGSSRIVVDSFTNMAFGSQFSVSLFFERTGGQQNYQGIVNNGYYKSGSFEIRMGREMGGEMLGGGVSRALGSPYGY